MPRKKISEEEKVTKKATVEKNIKKGKTSLEKEKKVEEKEKKVVAKKEESKAKTKDKKKVTKKEESKAKPKTKEKKTVAKKEETKALPKTKEKKALPKKEESKALPKVKEKKALPKGKEKKALPKAKVKKALPKTKEKKVLAKELSDEEKDLKILEKIKEFFFINSDKSSDIDKVIDENAKYLKEYYDLPYRYNETIVKILAQTPKRLFIYWDISDEDIQKYRRTFGEDFFEKTYPVLLVNNEEKNYTYEVPINDFANSWYIDINDSKCKYSVKLARKFKEYTNLIKEKQEKIIKENININNNYIEIVNSNTLEAPNDHVLFEQINSTVKYRNVKTKTETTKEIKNILSNFAKVYNVYDLYNVIYKNEMETDMFNLNNPSSAGNPSSSMTSIVF